MNKARMPELCILFSTILEILTSTIRDLKKIARLEKEEAMCAFARTHAHTHIPLSRINEFSKVIGMYKDINIFNKYSANSYTKNYKTSLRLKFK